MKLTTLIGSCVAFLMAIAVISIVVFTMKAATLSKHFPLTTPYMQRNVGLLDYKWVPLQEISPALQVAVVMAEDPRFFHHPGIDWTLMRFSLKRNLRDFEVVRGASTITMQLAKNLYLGPGRSLRSKLTQLMMAPILESVLSKNRILELYLNVAEFGPNLFGVEAASHFYFQKPAREIDPKEAAYLASLLPNPRMAAVEPYKTQFERARARILRHLEHRGF